MAWLEDGRQKSEVELLQIKNNYKNLKSCTKKRIPAY